MRFLVLFIFISLSVACSISPRQKEKALRYQIETLTVETMIIHDQVMMESGKIFQLKKQLKEIEAITTDTLVKKEVYSAVNDLEEADKLMMDWMHSYKPDQLSPLEEQLKYIDGEKLKIMEVERKTDESLVRATELIEKYGAK